ncbi:MAG TPA: TetR/AcrR family transcriptional regulator [Ktedonobacteraceae bacterium]|nr:TetR/AcrR family transcriptional regulator [Ktedonobacteraceae bacterium]
MNMNSFDNSQDEQKRGTRRKARTRAELLAAARQVFAERGFHDARIAEITQAADVGVGTFYLHFHDKDEAFNILLEEAMGEIRENVRNAVYQHVDAPAIPLIIRTLFRQAYKQRDLIQLALTIQFTRTRTFRIKEQIASGLRMALEVARARGELAGYNIPLQAHFIASMIVQSMQWWSEQDDPGPDEMADQLLLLLRQGLPEEILREQQNVSSSQSL